MRDGAPKGERGREVVLLAAASALLAGFLALKHAAWLPADLANLLVACAAGATAATVAGLVGAGRRLAHDRKVADELDGFADRLLRLEARIAALDGAGSRADSTLVDMEGDVHSLSQVVRSLAETVSGQEADLRQLKQRAATGMSYQAAAERDRPAASLPTPWNSIPSFLPARDGLEPRRPEAAPSVRPPVSAATDSDAIRIAAARGDIDLHVAPILALPQRSERAYATYPMLDLPEGRLLAPADYRPALERSGAAASFDGLVLEGALSLSRRIASLGRGAPVLVEIGDGALNDPALVARLDLLALVPAADHAGLVLLLSQRAFEGADLARGAFAALRDAGVCFALTGIGDINLNPAALARRGVRYVFLSAAALLEDAQRANFAALISALSESGIAAVAADVDDEAVVPELLDLGVPLAQGLGLALPCPADVLLQRLASTPDTALGPSARPAPPLDGPLRDFLRRAL